MQDLESGLLDQFESIEKAKAAQKKAAAAAAGLATKQRRPIFHKDQPVLVVTPEKEIGYFLVKRIGRRVIRLSGISRKEYERRTG